MPDFRTRHASAIAAAVLVASVGAFVVAIWLNVTGAPSSRLLNDPLATASEVLCFGVVGALLLARRPDLPFGWILALGALADVVLIGVGVPSLAAVDHHRAGALAAWGLGLGVLQWVPTALQGVVNVRFPTGQPSGVLGRAADRVLCWGIVLAVVGTYLGDSVVRDLRLIGDEAARRPVDGTWLTSAGNASLVLIPVLILLGILAGLAIVVRSFKATGVERRQLQWRAAGVVAALVLFPLEVTGVDGSLYGAVQPLLFVSTLVIPVLRYQLWSGDPVPRRRKVGPLVSRRTLVEAQEEERRRLRRELHDGLGPLLTGLRLNLDAVQAQLANDPDKALEHLATAREASAEVISDLRGLVYGLRPPALDELGLVGALRMHLTSLTAEAPLALTLELPEDPPSLPAAVEVALFRSASEAVTNVVRHSAAGHCRLALEVRRTEVALSVDDDGRVGDTWHAGVGLVSMRERALELGGTFLASSEPTGFHVRMTLPRR